MADPLKKLTKNEAAVLFWKCKGLTRPQIANRLGFSEDWVQLQSSTVYTKLGFETSMHWTKRKQILDKDICPRLPKDLKDWDFTEEVEEITPDPEMMALVLYDEKAIEQAEQSRQRAELQNKKPEVIVIPRRPNYFRLFVLLVIVLGLMAVVGVGAYFLGTRQEPVPVTEVFVVTAVTQVLPTPIPSPTPTPVDTGTPAPTLSPTPVPTNTTAPTAFVPPADGILFQDTFDTSIGNDWTQFSGTWIVSNGKLTKIFSDESKYEWITLNNPSWQNYILSMDIIKSEYDNIVVGVRNNTSNLKLIGIEINDREDMNLAFLGSIEYENELIAGDSGVDVPESFNIEIEVQGEIYIARLNSRETQRVTVSGYQSGGISIGLACYYEIQGCTLFDNIKITYLP